MRQEELRLSWIKDEKCYMCTAGMERVASCEGGNKAEK